MANEEEDQKWKKKQTRSEWRYIVVASLLFIRTLLLSSWRLSRPIFFLFFFLGETLVMSWQEYAMSSAEVPTSGHATTEPVLPTALTHARS